MKAFRLLCVSLLAAVSIVVVGAGPSWACSCVGGAASDFVDRADVVLLGTLTEADPPPERAVMSSMDPVTYHVEVARVFKGTSGGTAPATASFVADVERVTGAGEVPATAGAEGTAYTSELQLAADEDPAEPSLAGLAGPLGLVAGASLVLLTVPLWVRLLRR
ncbi:MAG: hypothetical protein ACTHKG_07445 [Nocardioides sp.]